jgi:hypothetical protein
MKAVFPRLLLFVFPALIAVSLAGPVRLRAQQAPDNFRWIDFHSEKEADTIVWVTRALASEKWTAIREIGVEYDAALVVTTLRATPQSGANADTFGVWSVSLTNHLLTPLVKGANLRLLDWMLFREGAPRELGALYDDCTNCQAATFFTAFHYDLQQRTWAARWMRGGQGVPVWSNNVPEGLTRNQVYAVIAEPDGRELLGTWNHFDYGKLKPAEDYVYLYEQDSFSGLERTEQLTGKAAEQMKQRMCRGQDGVPGLERGQNSPLCLQIAKPVYERRPVTTPPANNQGQSAPPGVRH